MGKMLYVDIEKCTGCRLCELACSFRHYDEYNPAKSRRDHIFRYFAHSVKKHGARGYAQREQSAGKR